MVRKFLRQEILLILHVPILPGFNESGFKLVSNMTIFLTKNSWDMVGFNNFFKEKKKENFDSQYKNLFFKIIFCVKI